MIADHVLRQGKATLDGRYVLGRHVSRVIEGHAKESRSFSKRVGVCRRSTCTGRVFGDLATVAGGDGVTNTAPVRSLHEASTVTAHAKTRFSTTCVHAGQTPNGVSDEMFADLGEHFDVGEQLEIVAVIAMFGFLNRWNSTLATDLEALPLSTLEKALED